MIVEKSTQTQKRLVRSKSILNLYVKMIELVVSPILQLINKNTIEHSINKDEKV